MLHDLFFVLVFLPFFPSGLGPKLKSILGDNRFGPNLGQHILGSSLLRAQIGSLGPIRVLALALALALALCALSRG